jgi:hypothetical protein
MTEETKNFMANNNNNLLIHNGIVNEKGESNVAPTAYYFDDANDDGVILLFNIIAIETDIAEIKAAVRNIRLYDTGEGKEPLLTPFASS